MATTNTVLVESKYVENIQTNQYIANGVKTTILAVTLNNSGSSGAFVTINIVPSAGTASAANQLVSSRYLAPGESYSCPEIVGQVLSPGAKLSAVASIASTIVIRVSGKEAS